MTQVMTIQVDGDDGYLDAMAKIEKAIDDGYKVVGYSAFFEPVRGHMVASVLLVKGEPVNDFRLTYSGGAFPLYGDSLFPPSTPIDAVSKLRIDE